MNSALVTLTSEESKRLIAKAIAVMPNVAQAKAEGIIGFSMCTSAGYVIEELQKTTIDLSRYCCGFLHENGQCLVHPQEETRQLALVKGEERWLNWPMEDLSSLIGEMGAGDIIVKSGNVLDRNGKAGVMVGCANGGEMGKYLPFIYGAGIQLIVPMTLNKFLPVDLDSVSKKMGVRKLEAKRSYGMTVGLMPLPGTVVTEIDALRILAGVEAEPVAAGGYGSGEGAVSIFMQGEKLQIEEAWTLLEAIKGEPELVVNFGECKSCVPAHELFGMRCQTRRKFNKKAV